MEQKQIIWTGYSATMLVNIPALFYTFGLTNEYFEVRTVSRTRGKRETYDKRQSPSLPIKRRKKSQYILINNLNMYKRFSGKN